MGFSTEVEFSPIVDFVSNMLLVESIPVFALLSNAFLLLENFVEAIPKGHKIRVSKVFLRYRYYSAINSINILEYLLKQTTLHLT